MFRKHWILAIASVVMTAASLSAGTFGTVVPIGGEAGDIALDPVRGVLYIANFTANRIDVMTLSNNAVQTSINVPNQPSSISVSPDGHWLLVANYGNNTTGSSTNALVLIDLTNNYSKQTFTLSNPPLTVSFGLDGKALVVTTGEFIIFDPTVGTTNLIRTIPQVTTLAIPQPPASFPANFTQATAAVSADGLTIAGMGGTGNAVLEYRYNVATHGLSATSYTAAPPPGPSVVSLSADGSLGTFFWGLQDANFNSPAQFPNPSGSFTVGTTLIDSSRGVIYAQIPLGATASSVTTTVTTTVGNTTTTVITSPNGTTVTTVCTISGNTQSCSSTTGTAAPSTTVAAPVLQIVASDNLTVIDQLGLNENLTGKSLLSPDNNTMYSISASGITILPVGSLGNYPRLTVSSEDLLFLGNFCERSALLKPSPLAIRAATHTVHYHDFNQPEYGIAIERDYPGQRNGLGGPRTVRGRKERLWPALSVTSTTGVNLAQTIRVLINSQDPSQRGTIVDVPGTVVDFSRTPCETPITFSARIRTGAGLQFLQQYADRSAAHLHTPKGMAITFDQQYLLVGCDGAHIMSMYDLDTLQAQPYISLPSDYVQSVAASSNAILATIRSGTGGPPAIDGRSTWCTAPEPRCPAWASGRTPWSIRARRIPSWPHRATARRF